MSFIELLGPNHLDTVTYMISKRYFPTKLKYPKEAYELATVPQGVSARRLRTTGIFY